MRHIPTSTEMVERFKKQAKKLQRKGGGKHAELLDRVARGAGYLHWHHVTLCQQQTQALRGIAALRSDCAIVLKAAREGVDKVVVTNVGELDQCLVLFASNGDAWLLDPDEGLATCLMFHGVEQELNVDETAREIRIGWDGTFALNGPGFVVETTHPEIGNRLIAGYPVDELRTWIDKAQSQSARFHALFDQADAVDLTSELIDRLVAEGWSREALDEAKQAGDRYSPSRNSLLTPVHFGSSEDD